VRLAKYRQERPLVLGIPRGGVPVAAEVARALGAELDVIVARKLGAPFQPEFAIGAVTANGGMYIDSELVRRIGVSQSYLYRVCQDESAEARRREELFRGGAPPPEVAGRTVILVDDGLATGATMRAAARSVRAGRPAKLVIAVPVGAAETCYALEEEADEVVCLAKPYPFVAVGLHYANFAQTSDTEVVRLLAEQRDRVSRKPSDRETVRVSPPELRP
jgi:predicted phosphoribosyltransferase